MFHCAVNLALPAEKVTAMIASEVLKTEILSHEGLPWELAAGLLEAHEPEDITALAALAHEVRRHFCGDGVDLCSIMNARSGRCPEDCAFCAQSAHYRTSIVEFALKPVPEMLAAAHLAQQQGAHRFCIVTSGNRLNDAEFAAVLEALQGIARETGLKRCASLGSLTPAQARALAQAGLQRYHHNLETASGFYSRICTTHSYRQRWETAKAVQAAGLELCSGGILNMGESPLQRLEFIFELKALSPQSLPLNFLNPRPGTPLQGQAVLPPLEAVKYIALFRLVIPRAIIRLAGGRCENLKQHYVDGLKAGINGLLIGNYLTTQGPAAAEDIAVLKALGYQTSAV